jgi:hypothetical protein
VQQLEANRPNLIETQSEGDLGKPVVIEVFVEQDGPVSLELLTKLLIVAVAFLATRHIAPSVAIVGAILSAFLPDVITALVRRRRWGKKRVGILAALAGCFATLDSVFGKAMGRRLHRIRGTARRALGVGHAVTTTAVAASVCAIAVAVPAVASGGSPFATTHPPVAAPLMHAHEQTQTPPGAAQHPVSPTPPTTSDLFRRIAVSPTGVPGSVKLTAGQRIHFEFTLEQPSRVLFAVRGNSTLTNYDISRDSRPSDANAIDINSTHPYEVDLAAGQHTFTIDPVGATAGTLNYVVYAATDAHETIEISPKGSPRRITVTPGQRAQVQFTLRQPSRIALAVSSGSTLTDYDISHDSGQDDVSSADIHPSTPYAPTTSLSAGTHTITIEPTGTESGTLLFMLSAQLG